MELRKILRQGTDVLGPPFPLTCNDFKCKYCDIKEAELGFIFSDYFKFILSASPIFFKTSGKLSTNLSNIANCISSGNKLILEFF